MEKKTPPPINYPKLLLAVIFGLSFIYLGVSLVKKNTTMGLIVGYANIIFWTAMFTFLIYTLIKRKLQK